jgi:hypothetical protein
MHNSADRNYVRMCNRKTDEMNIILQHPVALCILTLCFHSLPSLCNFVDILMQTSYTPDDGQLGRNMLCYIIKR